MLEERKTSVDFLPQETKTPERAPELVSAERSEGVNASVNRESTDLPLPPPLQEGGVAATAPAPERARQTVDTLRADVEALLADGLEQLYGGLPEEVRPKFKEAGEKLAAEAERMVEKGKIDPPKLLKALTAWLSLIPNVNVYYLRQESKIKLDTVLDYAAEHRPS